jgi:hypothetical protein
VELDLHFTRVTILKINVLLFVARLVLETLWLAEYPLYLQVHHLLLHHQIPLGPLQEVLEQHSLQNILPIMIPNLPKRVCDLESDYVKSAV